MTTKDPIVIEQSSGTSGQHIQRTRIRFDFPEQGMPRITYWGRSQSIAPIRTGNLYSAQQAQTLDAGMSESEFLSVLPTQAEGWTGEPSIVISRNGMLVYPSFAPTAVNSTDNSCTIEAISQDDAIAISLHFAIDSSGIITEWATLRNLSETALHVTALRLQLPIPPQVCELQTCTGHHLRERAPQRQPLTEGYFSKQIRTGRTDFNAATLLAVGVPGFSFEHGLIYGVHFGWSGNSATFAQRTPYTHGTIGGGELLEPGELILRKEEEYTTPTLFAVCGDGLNEIGTQFHSFIRAQHPKLRNGIRPVILNTWEAMYFEQDEDKITKLAHKAAELGIERFVIDDGWFSGRRNDTTSLGDWQPDRTIWPQGLSNVAATVHNLGMEFGLWFEPEMISPISVIAQQHPDWILAPNQHRLPMSSRQQQVIDLTNEDAKQYIHQCIRTLVKECGIDYIKWDHNRFLTEAISQHSGQVAVHGQTLAAYNIMDLLQKEFPSLEIESCSSGGGRIDAGILQRTDRVWASDCTDPIERADIQRYTSLLVPPEMIGEHISESPNHATGRTTTLTTRAAMALFGHLGIEWNIMKLQHQEYDELKEWIAIYKNLRANILSADVIHVDTPDPSLRVDGVVSPSRQHAVFRIATVSTSQEQPYGLIRFPGLDENATYTVKPLAGVKRYSTELSPTTRSQLGWWNDQGTQVSGDVLVQWGIRLPHIMPEHAILVELEQQE